MPIDHRVRALRVSGESTPRASRCSPTPAPISRRITRPSSTRRCSTTSRWGSITRRRSSATRSGTGRSIHPADVDFLGLALRDRARRRRAARARARARACGRRSASASRRSAGAALRLGGRSRRARRAPPRRADAARPRSGALASLEPERRAALWQAERAGRPRGPLYEGLAGCARALAAPGDDAGGAARRRLRGHRPQPGAASHGVPPRAARRGCGVARAADLAALRDGASSGSPARWSCASGRARPRASCSCRSRTRPGSPTRSCAPPSSTAPALALVNEPFLFVEGVLQHQDNVVSVRAERLAAAAPPAHRGALSRLPLRRSMGAPP